MRLLIALSITLSAFALHDHARACGGFFCNSNIPPGSPGPIRIVQDGERVLFAKTDTGVTMIVEVRYDGDPTSFAWLLPIPGLPDGMDLEDALDVSVAEVFSTLQSATDPTFTATINQGGLGNQCAQATSSDGCGCADESADKGLAAGNDGGGGVAELPPPNPYVSIADSARVGSYEAQHIVAQNAGALYDWLGQNGYYQDEAARPLLEEYIADGWSFIGIKLVNGASAGDVKPLVLHLGEEAPCVPLRLTRIAANDGMPILVWVLGAARAIPKNFVHAVINDEAVSFPNGPDYLDVLDAAIDQGSGHAWVTELAVSTAGFAPRFGDGETTLVDGSLAAVLGAIPSFAFGPTLDRVLRAEIVKPADVDEEAWQSNPPQQFDLTQAELVHDLATLRDRIVAEVLEPLALVHDLFAETKVLTRFYTVQDAAEMTKDPIFGFNAELPMVSNVHNVVASSGVDENCNAVWEVVYPDGRVVRHDPSTVQSSGFVARPDASPLLRAEVVDEEGQAQAFDPSQAVEVDRALDGATLGIPSIPSGFELKPPKPSGPAADQKRVDPGCSVSLSGFFVFGPLLFLWLRRRQGSSM